MITPAGLQQAYPLSTPGQQKNAAGNMQRPEQDKNPEQVAAGQQNESPARSAIQNLTPETAEARQAASQLQSASSVSSQRGTVLDITV
jgi:hypothetical protein